MRECVNESTSVASRRVGARRSVLDDGRRTRVSLVRSFLVVARAALSVARNGTRARAHAFSSFSRKAHSIDRSS
jgi:hypothetical protein